MVLMDRVILVVCFLGLFSIEQTDAKVTHPSCTIPDEYHGSWYSWVPVPREVYTNVDANSWDSMVCEDIHVYTKQSPDQGRDATILLHDSTSGCYHCVYVTWSATNVLHYFKENCLRPDVSKKIVNLCKDKYSLSKETFYTMYSLTPQDVGCTSTLLGEYQFALGLAGVCNKSQNHISATSDRLTMTFAKCTDTSSKNVVKNYQCLGSWEEKHGLFTALKATDETDTREKFKCLVTGGYQIMEGNKQLWGMSRFADCGWISSVYSAPIKFIVVPSS